MVADVIKIIRENSTHFEYKEGEDIELDIGELSSSTLWKLASFMKTHKSKDKDNGVFVNKVCRVLCLVFQSGPILSNTKRYNLVSCGNLIEVLHCAENSCK